MQKVDFHYFEEYNTDHYYDMRINIYLNLLYQTSTNYVDNLVSYTTTDFFIKTGNFRQLLYFCQF